jgi:hypothetical protein
VLAEEHLLGGLPIMCHRSRSWDNGWTEDGLSCGGGPISTSGTGLGLWGSWNVEARIGRSRSHLAHTIGRLDLVPVRLALLPRDHVNMRGWVQTFSVFIRWFMLVVVGGVAWFGVGHQ